MVVDVVRDPRFDKEFLALPPSVRDACWRVMGGLRRRPFAPGIGYQVQKLRKVPSAEAWVAHFYRNSYRLVYIVDGNRLILIGVGERPGFYRRLDRLRGV
jgi:hypothetical protein